MSFSKSYKTEAEKTILSMKRKRISSISSHVDFFGWHMRVLLLFALMPSSLAICLQVFEMRHFKTCRQGHFPCLCYTCYLQKHSRMQTAGHREMRRALTQIKKKKKKVCTALGCFFLWAKIKVFLCWNCASTLSHCIRPWPFSLPGIHTQSSLFTLTLQCTPKDKEAGRQAASNQGEQNESNTKKSAVCSFLHERPLTLDFSRTQSNTHWKNNVFKHTLKKKINTLQEQ